ncbi:MAG: DUF2490 domain-containing protein [Paludibacteraceae bacterium]|nr:DUF2490 domain-containing protein [Paludibacteraceae bacterium]
MMKRYFFVLCLLISSLGLYAWDWTETPTSTTTHSFQLRAEANFTKKWDQGVSLHIAEDLRFDMVGVTDGVVSKPAFNKSYTTLSLGYKNPHFKYLKADVGYTLKIMGDKDWSVVSKWMRHRVFFGVTGSYRYEQWSFSLRERFLTEIRMGDIDQHIATGYYEHNRADWYLRSKFEVAYHAMSKPLKPYIWCELVNTLNANPLQQKYKDNDPTNTGHQYIRRVRTSLGVVWKLNKTNSLDFYYRFNYGYDRDVTVKANSQKLYLTEETSFQHAIGVAYNLGW